MTTLVDEMLEQAKLAQPNEACGLIVTFEDGGKKHRLIVAKNVHESPRNTFQIDDEAWLQVRDEEVVIGVWHSHVNSNAEPSMADLAMCEATGLPWHIVSVEGDYRYIEPSGYLAPYEKRPYVYGVHDCYTLARDWYKREKGVDLPEIERPNRWWEKGQSLLVENFEMAGFSSIPMDEPAQRGDIFIVQVNSRVPNHVIIHLGDGTILHHVEGRVSCREVWGGYWAQYAVLHLRHIRTLGTT